MQPGEISLKIWHLNWNSKTGKSEQGHSRQYMQRPRGKKESGMFKELEEDQYAESIVNRGVGGNWWGVKGRFRPIHMEPYGYVKNSVYFQSETGSHWRVSSRWVIWSDLFVNNHYCC